MGIYNPDNPMDVFPVVFGRFINLTIARGGKVRFNLDGVDVPTALNGNHTAFVGRYTAWELQHIRRPGWFEHTVFYRNGRALTPEEVQALGIQPWTPPN